MKFLFLQILIVASVEFNSILGQYQQHFPAQAHYHIQQHHQHHPSPRPQEHHEYRQPTQSFNGVFQPTQAPFDFDKFNQQAKQLQAQVNYFNLQQRKQLQQQFNSVHQDGTGPHFDFVVNDNFTDLENASEQFVNIGNLVGKQNMPAKVIKITKTVAVKQPVPVPYPVPVVKMMKDPSQIEFSHHGYSGHQHQHHHQQHDHVSSTTAMPSSFTPASYFNYSSYTNQFSTPPTAPSQSYQQQQSTPNLGEYDTEPFYVTNNEKEIVKIVPVPYYVDDEGNKHEISSSSSHASSSHDVDSDAFYPNRQTTESPESSGKFQTFHYSYHPAAAPQNAHAQPLQHYSQAPHSAPETKYYYNQESDNSAANTDASQYASDPNDEQQQYQYKYVSYE